MEVTRIYKEALGVAAFAAMALCATSVARPFPKAIVKPGTPQVEPPPPNTVDISRNQLDQEGVVRSGTLAGARLPASLQFKAGNLFSVQGKWVRVGHASSNSQSPAFKWPNREKFFQDNGLYPQEQDLLDYSSLYLYPALGTGPKKALETWVEDLDVLLRLHENDRWVVRCIESFVLKYASQPPRGYLPGDQLWDTKRTFATWNQFFETPLLYDLSGKGLLVDGHTFEEAPSSIPKEKVAGAPKLFPQVVRNLEYSYEALRTTLVETGGKEGDAGLVEATKARRAYLSLRLLRAGHELWNKMQ